VDVAYLRVTTRESGRRYYYICRSVRKGDRVTTRVLEYLGAAPSRERLKRALEYWGVGKRRRAKPGTGGR